MKISADSERRLTNYPLQHTPLASAALTEATARDMELTAHPRLLADMHTFAQS